MTDFKKCVVYQIYPKSFYDSNGDGFGDLKGVTEKLDYIKTLGVDYIWLTPFYVSPQNDNGYDVEDYYHVDPRYGTMQDFEVLLEEAAKKGIRIMLDMVFNHTSSHHEWFQKALAGEEKYKNFYFFRKGKEDGTVPTNWESKFGGSVWEYVDAFDEYYLHLFDVSQPDLNWDNPQVREEICKILKFWIKKGVKGFRFDVVNLISKGSFEDDTKGDGRRFYTDGPNIHTYLQEISRAIADEDAEIITVGEMSSTSLENCYKYAGEDCKELSMVFSFHHLKVDFMDNEKWVMIPYDFDKLKRILFEWQTKMAAHHAWNAVFWCNHDQPRIVSRFGDEGEYWKESAKMLATAIHCLRGTPYIYQGEELGMTNAGFTDISQYRDVESLNHFRILQDKGMSREQAYEILRIHSRDNSRTPMQWSDEKNAGFTAGNPWIEINPNYRYINAQTEIKDEDSIFYHYQKLIQLRKEYDVVAYGDIEPMALDHPSVFAYKRRWKNEELTVVNNFYKKETVLNIGEPINDYRCLISNYDRPDMKKDQVTLRPFESFVLYRKN